MCTWQSLQQLRQIFFAFKIEHPSVLAFARLINPHKKKGKKLGQAQAVPRLAQFTEESYYEFIFVQSFIM